MGNYHEQFRGGLGAVMRPGYPTVVAPAVGCLGTEVGQTGMGPT